MIFVGRLLRIGFAATGFTAYALYLRLFRPQRTPALAQRFAATLDRLGTTFVKFGQILSLHRELLPDSYIKALTSLHDRVVPFPVAQAVREVEVAFGRPVTELFAEFEPVPLAAASIAQVHRARLHDGRAVIVKVRRPAIRAEIDRDMRMLRALARLAEFLIPRLRRFRALDLVEETWANLRKETDFRQEARNSRRFKEAFKDWKTVHAPGVVDELYAESVLVQEMGGGRRVDDPSIGKDGRRLAENFVDAYLHQFFVLGIFHGDPHPGNLFVMDGGRICFHDFGLIGYLDRTTRRNLALFAQAFVHQDSAWLLDTAIALGLISATVNRAEFRRSLEEIVAEYAALPPKDLSLAQAFLQIVRLGHGEGAIVPRNLLVFMRAMFLIESTVRSLDPEFPLVKELLAKGEKIFEVVVQGSPSAARVERLKSEAAVTAQDLPALLGAWLHRLQGESGGLELGLRLHGIDRVEEALERGSRRVALALVSMGLYVGASLLVQFDVGPHVFEDYVDLPILGVLGFGVALWLTLRVARS